jgi:LPS-assembly protein
VEEGGRLSLGLSWTRQGPGVVSNLAFGRILRTETGGFSEASGLSGRVSDWLVSGQLDLEGGFVLDARTLLDGGDGSGIGKSEAQVDWSGTDVSLSAGFLYLPADVDEDRAERAAEWTVDAEWRPSGRWSLGVETRYDAANRTPARLGLEVGWRSECVEVDVSLARRYTSTDGDGPTTTFGLSVNLNGFSAGGEPRVAPGTCRR